MSAGVMRHTIAVRNPETLEVKALLAGEEVPDWAADLVHPDDLEDGGSVSADDASELKGQALDEALEAAGLPKTGTADEKRQRLAEYLADSDSDDDEDDEDDTESYSALKKADLEALVAERNEGRAEDEVIEVAGSGTKADLIAALEADDAKSE